MLLPPGHRRVDPVARGTYVELRPKSVALLSIVKDHFVPEPVYPQSVVLVPTAVAWLSLLPSKDSPLIVATTNCQQIRIRHEDGVDGDGWTVCPLLSNER